MTKDNNKLVKEALEVVAEEKKQTVKAHYVYYCKANNKLYIKTGNVDKAKESLKRLVNDNGGKKDGDIITRVNAYNSDHATTLFNEQFKVNAEKVITRHHEPRPTFEEFTID